MMELTVPGTNGNPTVSMRCADIGDDYYNCLLCFLRPSRPHEAGDRYRLSFRARAAEGTEFFAGIQFLSKQSAEDAGGKKQPQAERQSQAGTERSRKSKQSLLFHNKTPS